MVWYVHPGGGGVLGIYIGGVCPGTPKKGGLKHQDNTVYEGHMAFIKLTKH